MTQVLEAVPNFSEGRDVAKIEQLEAEHAAKDTRIAELEAEQAAQNLASREQIE